MSKYVLLYTGGGMSGTEAEQKAAMKAWEDWFGKLGKAVADQGDPFKPAAKTIGANGAVSDGAVGTAATGYSIIEADSLDAAVKLAKGCPALQGGAKITVYETMGVM